MLQFRKGRRATFSLIFYRVYDTCRPTNGVTKCAEAMAAPGRRILAADESSGTIKKRFDTLGAPCRDVLSTPAKSEDFCLEGSPYTA
jgi:hypothetical protein